MLSYVLLKSTLFIIYLKLTNAVGIQLNTCSEVQTGMERDGTECFPLQVLIQWVALIWGQKDFLIC